MSDNESDSSDKKDPPASRKSDDSRLAKLLLQPVWTEEQAEQVLKAQRKSRQTICEFATRRGLTPSRLYAWRKRLDEKPAPVDSAGANPDEEQEDLPPLIKVEVSGSAAAPRPAPPTKAVAQVEPSCITVCLPSGVRIQIPAGAPEALISTVLWTMRTQSC